MKARQISNSYNGVRTHRKDKRGKQNDSNGKIIRSINVAMVTNRLIYVRNCCLFLVS